MTRFAIAIGGMAGAFSRYGTGALVSAWWGATLFPWGTLAVNMLGSLGLGLLMQLFTATTLSPVVRAGLTVGFFGGFTTFSAFAYETVALTRGGHEALAAAYVGASLLLGATAMLAGLQIGAAITRRPGSPSHGATIRS
jgi:fluoride exporter